MVRHFIYDALFLCALAVASGHAQNRGTFVDTRDGREYKWTAIDGVVWMAENLNYGKLHKTPAGCVDEWNGACKLCYGNDSRKCDMYGGLYDYDDAVKSCPPGWRLPNQNEWLALKERGEKSGLRSNKQDSWDVYQYDFGRNLAEGNQLGWSALPGGDYSSEYNGFGHIGMEARWWVNNGEGGLESWGGDLGCYSCSESVMTLTGGGCLEHEAASCCDAVSVRCVKD